MQWSFIKVSFHHFWIFFFFFSFTEFPLLFIFGYCIYCLREVPTLHLDTGYLHPLTLPVSSFPIQGPHLRLIAKWACFNKKNFFKNMYIIVFYWNKNHEILLNMHIYQSKTHMMTIASICIFLFQSCMVEH